MWGAKPSGQIEPKFFLEVDIFDVITCFKFGDDRFRGLASAEGQILPFPIDFDGRPYNTLTLPCERVIPACIHDLQSGHVDGTLPTIAYWSLISHYWDVVKTLQWRHCCQADCSGCDFG